MDSFTLTIYYILCCSSLRVCVVAFQDVRLSPPPHSVTESYMILYFKLYTAINITELSRKPSPVFLKIIKSKEVQKV